MLVRNNWKPMTSLATPGKEIPCLVAFSMEFVSNDFGFLVFVACLNIEHFLRPVAVDYRFSIYRPALPRANVVQIVDHQTLVKI